MTDKAEAGEPQNSGNPSGEKTKGKRKRRRRRGGGGVSGASSATPKDWSPTVTSGNSEGTPQRKGRRQAVDFSGPQITLPATGRNPHKKKSSRPKRSAPSSAGARKRRLSRVEVKELQEWLGEMPEHLLANLYRGLGGQPKRVANAERMIQLSAKAIAQGGRLGSLLKSLRERDRKAMAALLQCGGLAYSTEFIREVKLSYGGHDREWQKTMSTLADKGVVLASAEKDGGFFYIVPEVLVSGLVESLPDEMGLPTFSHSDVRVIDQEPFCPPLGFSITSLAAYIDQNAPRLSQRQEIYRHDQETMDRFFAQIWKSDSELFSFHLDFLMMHGMIELRGEYLSLNVDVTEEWLQLEAEDQRDLLFRALEKRFPMAEWVLWAVHGALKAGGDEEWVAERPLVDLYRRWVRGADWRDRFNRNAYANVRTSERESFSFAPLVRAGILEMGQWGQEKFYRLSRRGRHLLEPDEEDGFHQFYLTPSFEIMAPAGLSPVLLFRIGELAELVGCDRANTYKITEATIERAMDRGWRRDDVLQFLRDNSQIGLPDNVEATLKGWIGHRGDVEFHELCLMTVHRSQIRRLEGNKKIKSYLLHRFAPGMYAIDPNRRADLNAVLEECGFMPGRELRAYPGAPEQVEARQNLHRLVAEAREDALNPVSRGSSIVPPGSLHALPGTKLASLGESKVELPPLVEVDEVRMLLDRAMSKDGQVEMVYLAKNGQRLALVVHPQRIAFKGEAPVLVGVDTADSERRTFVLDRIERLRVMA
jgi:hypothetical protein